MGRGRDRHGGGGGSRRGREWQDEGGGGSRDAEDEGEERGERSQDGERVGGGEKSEGGGHAGGGDEEQDRGIGWRRGGWFSGREGEGEGEGRENGAQESPAAGFEEGEGGKASLYAGSDGWSWLKGPRGGLLRRLGGARSSWRCRLAKRCW